MSGDATGVVQADDNVVLTAGWLRRLVNSGIGDDDETACAVEAMIRCPDEESGKAVEDARRLRLAKQEIREQKNGEVMATSPPRLPLRGESP